MRKAEALDVFGLFTHMAYLPLKRLTTCKGDTFNRWVQIQSGFILCTVNISFMLPTSSGNSSLTNDKINEVLPTSSRLKNNKNT